MEISLLLLTLRLTLGLSEGGSEGVRTVASTLKCSLQGSKRLPAFTMNGDFIIGGAFSIHYKELTKTHNYTAVPEPPSCARGINSRELRFSRTMIFAIKEINNSTELLPGVKLGYQIYDSCASVPVSIQAAFQLSNGQDPAFQTDKEQYPTFFRTIPSDQFQADALAKLVKHFALKEGICVDYIESFYRTDPTSKIREVANTIRRSTAVVVVAFTAAGDMKFLLEELAQDPPPPRQWIGSESWVTDPLLMSFSFCAGAIGVAIQQSVIPGLRDFLLDLSPSEVAASSVLTEFWEDSFNCNLTERDPLAFYELVNWQKSESGVNELITVGYYDASLPKGQEFRIYKNLTWMKGSVQDNSNGQG
ncbi:hypothetical protein CRENBAI_026025 [Crenichthys baileyi]|uniref:Receptor ligand binding region domain-containing protein n=1 Tax=Crenichthys baileyi TaxID=28760 RepID=A0AAV9RZJ0_9TELE